MKLSTKAFLVLFAFCAPTTLNLTSCSGPDEETTTTTSTTTTTTGTTTTTIVSL